MRQRGWNCEVLGDLLIELILQMIIQLIVEQFFKISIHILSSNTKPKIQKSKRDREEDCMRWYSRSKSHL